MTSKKICVLGSSYIGAVYSAYKLNRPSEERYAIDFYGHGNGGFPHVDVVGGHFQNVRFKSVDNLVDISSYDAFVIYADMPSPHGILKIISTCMNEGRSRQLVEAVVSDVISSTATVRIFKKLVSATGRPVLILSSNVVSTSRSKMTSEKYDDILQMIEKAVGLGSYIEFPRNLFDEKYWPLPEFYKDSVLLTGEQALDHPGHDNHHMNALGGAEILKVIITYLDRVL